MSINQSNDGIEQLPTMIENGCYVHSASGNRQLFQDNLNILLSQLNATDSSSYIAGFNHTSVGVDPNKLYGLFLCRPDITSRACRVCVATASQRILQDCPGFKDSVIWYDLCMLTYSNEPIYGKVRTMSSYIWWVGYTNNSMPIKPQRFLNSTLDELIPKAANTLVAGKKFAVQQTSFTESDRPIYLLAQCTPDLTPDRCNSCLRIANDLVLPRGMDGDVSAVLQSCNIRYASYRFYNETAIELLSSPREDVPTPPTSSAGLSTGEIVAIIVASSMAALFLFILCFSLWRRARSAKETRRGTNDGLDKSSLIIVILVPTTCFLIIIIVATVLVLCRLGKLSWKQKDDYKIGTLASSEDSLSDNNLIFKLVDIKAATCDFSNTNKLGEGGFGTVYKGRLLGGQEIAVKRLEHSSNEGKKQFMNEISLMARLQHKNLVRFLGFCAEEGERLLVYEYVPYASLDRFISDPNKLVLLDWEKRYGIINGIARGLLYLHTDSQIKIIHCDLKPGNILLDDKMNPKIADFGTARLFASDQSGIRTRRITGTYGYMPPEYVQSGDISSKTDVYSFGVMMLEIISGQKHGKRNNSGSLVHLAWQLWKGGKAESLVDPFIKDSKPAVIKILDCIQIALMCVQADVARRPTMASVCSMLNDESCIVPKPSRPAFLYEDSTMEPSIHSSINEVSFSDMHHPR